MAKGVSPLISMVFYVAVIISAIAIVMGVAMPTLTRMQETASVQNNIDNLKQIDGLVREVASEGLYSSRVTSLSFQRGQYLLENSSNKLYYRINTTSNIISANTTVTDGPVKLSSTPTFADTDKKTINASLSYKNISLSGFNGILSPGDYKVVITNDGLQDGEAQVRISIN